MSARPIAAQRGPLPVPAPSRAAHPWPVVLHVLTGLVVLLGVGTVAVVASSAGLVSDVGRAATSLFGQP